MFRFSSFSPYDVLIQEYGFKPAYTIFLLDQKPPEALGPKLPKHCMGNYQEIREKQREGWSFFLKEESKEDFHNRKRAQWLYYANSLVIIAPSNSAENFNIYAVDNEGNAKIVSVPLSNYDSFLSNVVPKLRKFNRGADGAFAISQEEYIKNITCYTGYHIESPIRFKKGLEANAIINELKSLDDLVIVKHSSEYYHRPSPTSVMRSFSPSKMSTNKPASLTRTYSPIDYQPTLYKSSSDFQRHNSDDELRLSPK